MLTGRVSATLIALAAAGAASPTRAGEPDPIDPERLPDEVPRLDVTGTATVAGEDPAGLTLVPVIGPIFNPEFQLMITGGAILSFRTTRTDLRLNRSTLMAAAGYSTNGAVFAGGVFNSYWAGDAFRLKAVATIKDMPDNFWGTGYDNGRNVPQGAATTQFERFWWEVRAEPSFRLIGPLYGGGSVHWTETRARNVNPRMRTDPDFIATGRRNALFGFGPTLSLDTRDVPDAAWRGFLVKAAASFFGADDPSRDFNQVEIDYRQYVPIVKKGWTLAWNVWTRMTFGNVPWHEMPQLGMQPSFRGYFTGQFRDKRAYTAVVEYRHMLHGGRYTGEDSKIESDDIWQFLGNRLGFVVFGGFGGVGRNIEDFENVAPIGGGGLRFLVSGRLHLRADIGVGIESGAFYLGVNEAF